jgi:hypothetical protein
MANTITKILQNIASFSSLLPLILFFIFQRNNKSKELRVISFYLIYAALNDIVAFYLFQIANLRPFFIYDIFAVVEFSFFSWFFYLVINNHNIKRLILPIVVLFCMFSLSLYVFLPESNSFSSIIAGVESVLIISMCIYYFFDQLKESNTLLIYASINFWRIISFLIYLSGTFFLYIYSESRINDKTFIKEYIIINSSFIILKGILLGVAMLMKPINNHNQNIFPEDRLNADWNTNQAL